MNAGSPLVGFGVYAQYNARYPGGMQGLCDRYRDRLTQLSIVSLPNTRLARKFKDECAHGLPLLHRLSGIAPARSCRTEARQAA